MSKERTGFIGVGLMGHGMAGNLVDKGWPLTVMGHRNRKPVEDLVGRGASEAKTPREVAQNSDILFICVTGTPQVESLVRGPDGILEGVHENLVVVDTSTAIPDSTMALAEELKARGAAMADAPLGGTPVQAAAGELSAMVGADPDVFTRIEPAIRAWAGRVVHLGAVGSGHKMKLLNNFLSLGYAAIYAEALAVARKNGLSVETFDSVIRGSRMDCGFYQTFMGYALEGNPEAHKFTLSNAHKDMRYMAAMANESGIANHIGAAVKNMFAFAEGIGRGQDYVPFLADIVAESNGVKIKK